MRGEIWTVAGGAQYAGKPRPALIVQADAFDATELVTICMVTHHGPEDQDLRLRVDASETNGLGRTSYLMVDKITTIHKRNLGKKIGEIDAASLLRFNRAAIVFLGLLS